MTRHLLKLVWNRKRTTGLVMLEIAAAFIVLALVAGFAVYALDNWRRPIGFEWAQVWDIEVNRRSAEADDGRIVSQEIEPDAAPSGAETAAATPAVEAPPDPRARRGESSDRETLRQMILALRELPEIEATATAGVAPFEMGGMVESRTRDGQRLEFGANEVSDTYADLLGLKVTRGRWFGPDDTGQSYDAVVITEEFRRDWFGDADPVGKPLIELDAGDLQRGARLTRVVGVVEAYREDGEFDGTRNFALYRSDLSAPSQRSGRLPRHILIRVRPGTPAAFEETLVKRLQAAAPSWSFEVRQAAAMRESQLRFTLVPLAAVGVVAGSLLLMVALGLLGVMWQAVTQRTREIGLRRAKGATRVRIRRQVLGEIVVMTTLGIVPAIFLLAQVPLLSPFYWVSPHVYAVALALSLVAIYVLALFCGWYPARLATAVDPAEALRYE